MSRAARSRMTMEDGTVICFEPTIFRRPEIYRPPVGEALLVAVHASEFYHPLIEFAERVVDAKGSIVWQLVGGDPLNQADVLLWAYPPQISAADIVASSA